MSIRWQGSFDFAGLQARKNAAKPRALAAGMQVVRTVTTPKVPVETGHLAGSGQITVVGNRAEIRYPGPYARYQEFGVFYRHGRVGAPLTHSHGQSFYLTTGLHEASAAALEEVARVLGDAL